MPEPRQLKNRNIDTVVQQLNLPLVSQIPRERLRHHIILPEEVERRFQQVEREYVARDRLAHSGLRFQQKVLLYGPSGCGKSLGAERVAWNVGLPFLKIVLDCSRESADNLRRVFEETDQYPCLLFLDGCDAIAKTRKDPQEASETQRIVNILLDVLDKYTSSSGMLIASANLDKSLNPNFLQRFDGVIAVPRPGTPEFRTIMDQVLCNVTVGSVAWEKIIRSFHQNTASASQAMQVAQSAAKQAVLDNKELVTQEHLERAIADILLSNFHASK